jgi:hypothetical protein
MEPVTKTKEAETEDRFPLGDVMVTRQAFDRLAPEDIQRALQLHARGDWGLVCPEDRQSNEEALAEGLRLFSVYEDKSSTRFWIITEWDRSLTTVLLPGDY